MSDEKFVYAIYIAGTAEKVWNALLDPKFTREYWGYDNVSDWKPGSAWEHRKADGSPLLVGEVLESVPPRRLVLTWADPKDKGNPARKTRVTIELQQIEDMVQLSLTHDRFDHVPDLLPRIASGWPRVLSSLKSLLETGKPLNTWAGR